MPAALAARCRSAGQRLRDSRHTSQQRQPGRKKDEFANADAEKWFAFHRLLEKREVILPVDGELLKQLSSRRLQYYAKARIQLEPKESMRARGLSSLTGPMRSSVPPFRACPVLAEARSRGRPGPHQIRRLASAF